MRRSRAFRYVRALVYDYATALLQERRADAALKLIESQLQVITGDYRLYQLQSRAYAALGDGWRSIARRPKPMSVWAISRQRWSSSRSV